MSANLTNYMYQLCIALMLAYCGGGKQHSVQIASNANHLLNCFCIPYKDIILYICMGFHWDRFGM